MRHLLWVLLIGLTCLPVRQTSAANICQLGGAAVPEPAGLDGSGLGGTGLQQDGSGIGGTGLQASTDRTGLGGTGHAPGDRYEEGLGGTGNREDGSGMGGTGVVGVITGFGSVCVNGLEFFYDAATPVSVDGEPASPQGLAVGQWVAIEGDGQGDALRARHIKVQSAVVGSISWVSPTGDSLVVLGQKVRLNQIGLPNRAAGQADPKPGQTVRVNGVRNAQGEILATRVDPAEPGAPARVSGELTPVARGMGKIGNLVVTGLPDNLTGGQVSLKGRDVGDMMRVEAVSQPARGLEDSRLMRQIVQGPVIDKRSNGEINLGYLRVKVSPEQARTLEKGDWVRIEQRRNASGKIETLELGREGLVKRAAEPSRVNRETRGSRERHEGAEADESSRETSRSAERDGQHERRDEDRSRRESGTPERAGKSESQERFEKTTKVEKAEKIERAEKAEKAEKVEKVERPEKTEKPEKPEKIEKPERPERRED